MLSLAKIAPVPSDPSARFATLYAQLASPLTGLVYRLVGNRADAEEVVQEAFTRLARDKVLQRPDEEVAAWLRRVCLNLGTNRLRDERRARARIERAGQLTVADPGSDLDDPVRSAIRREEQAAVRAALTKLPDRQRDCLLLRHGGYSYAEIAATLGIAVGSVGVLLTRAEAAFRRLYEEHDHDLS